MTEYNKKWKENVKILIVEDSITQGEKLKFILEEEGFAVEWVMTAEKALEFLEKETPTIIISDVLMPQMNGFQLCALLKENHRWKQIPVILLTTLSEPYDILKGLESGADNFITKPYNRDYLLSRLEYLLVNLRLRSMSRQQNPEMGIEIYFAGKKHRITSERLQILDLLFSTYEAIIQKNIELERLNRELKLANEKIKSLSGLIPICPKCKKVRNDEGYWQEVEVYVADHTDAGFTHGICNDCVKLLYPDFYEKMIKKRKKTGKEN
jgi:two-component system, OmpR family, response regulator VanR